MTSLSTHFEFILLCLFAAFIFAASISCSSRTRIALEIESDSTSFQPKEFLSSRGGNPHVTIQNSLEKVGEGVTSETDPLTARPLSLRKTLTYSPNPSQGGQTRKRKILFDCDPGYYGFSCQTCPPGHFCDGSDIYTCPPGRWSSAGTGSSNDWRE